MREVVLEEKLAQGQADGASAPSTPASAAKARTRAAMGSPEEKVRLYPIKAFVCCRCIHILLPQTVAMEEALLHEQQKNGKILMQLVVMTNELNERDSQIALLKKKEEHYEQTLLERENLFKQVSSQLSWCFFIGLLSSWHC